MEKSLKDILARLAGVNNSEIVDGSTGTKPGVDYAPKPKDEQDFVAKHKTEKHKDRVGNDDVTYKGTTRYSLERDEKHGHKSPKDKQVYDNKLKEEKHIFHVHFPDDMSDRFQMPSGGKPKSTRLKLTIPASNRTEATNKAARYVAKNYGTRAKLTHAGVDESAACNMTEEGTACPVHEMAACTSKKPLREIAKKMKKEQSAPATPPITPPGMSVNRSII